MGQPLRQTLLDRERGLLVLCESCNVGGGASVQVLPWREQGPGRRHRRVSLLHLRGVPWARIGEWVRQKNLAVTANTYTHVLTDTTELDYTGLLSA